MDLISELSENKIKQEFIKIIPTYRNNEQSLKSRNPKRGDVVSLRDINGYFHFLSRDLLLFDSLLLINFEEFRGENIYGSNPQNIRGGTDEYSYLNKDEKIILPYLKIHEIPKAYYAGEEKPRFMETEMHIEKVFVGKYEVIKSLEEQQNFYLDLKKQYNKVGRIHPGNEKNWIEFVDKHHIRLL